MATIRWSRFCASSSSGVEPAISAEIQLKRPSHPEALNVIDPDPAQQLQRGGVLDSLSHRPETKRLGHRHHAGDQSLVGRAPDQVADEFHVDLEVADGQMLQVGEGSKPGPEVIQGERAAQPLKLLCELPSALKIAHRGRLGDLEREQTWVKTI